MRRKEFCERIIAPLSLVCTSLTEKEFNKARQVKKLVQSMATSELLIGEQFFIEGLKKSIQDIVYGKCLNLSIGSFDYSLVVDSRSEFRPYDKDGWLHIWIRNKREDISGSLVYLSDKGVNGLFNIGRIRSNKITKERLEFLLQSRIDFPEKIFDKDELVFFLNNEMAKTDGNATIYKELFQRLYDKTLDRVIMHYSV